MELPTIGTNFGGNLAFMDEHNSLLVNVSHFEPSDDPSFKWAQPDTAHLRQLMRHVFDARQSAVSALPSMCRRGRQTVVDHFSPDAVGRTIANRLSHAYAELGRRRQSAATIEKEAHDDVEAMFTEPTVGPRRTTCVQQTITPALRLLSKCSNVFGQAQSRAQCPEPCLKVLKHLAISCSYQSGQFAAETASEQMTLVNQLLHLCNVLSQQQIAAHSNTQRHGSVAQTTGNEQLLDPYFDK